MRRSWFDDWCAKCGHWSKCDCTMHPNDRGAGVSLTALTLATLLTGCATCPPLPGPPVWALATVPDSADHNQ